MMLVGDNKEDLLKGLVEEIYQRGMQRLAEHTSKYIDEYLAEKDNVPLSTYWLGERVKEFMQEVIDGK